MNGKGLCLLNRNEEKFECSYRKANALITKLINQGFKQERFFNKFTSERIATLAFVDLSNLDFEKYSWKRLRKYYLKKVTEKRELWLEVRARNKMRVCKKRKMFNEKELERFVKKQKTTPPIIFIDYLRKSFDQKEKKIRVTIDTEIKYYGLPPVLNKFRFGQKVGGEKIAIVKIKYVGDLPKIFVNLKTGLLPPRSKLKRGIRFLKLSGELK